MTKEEFNDFIDDNALDIGDAIIIIFEEKQEKKVALSNAYASGEPPSIVVVDIDHPEAEPREIELDRITGLKT